MLLILSAPLCGYWHWHRLLQYRRCKRLMGLLTAGYVLLLFKAGLAPLLRCCERRSHFQYSWFQIRDRLRGFSLILYIVLYHLESNDELLVKLLSQKN